MSNNTSQDLFFQSASSESVLTLHDTTPTFAIPLFKPSKLSNLDYCPTVNHKRRIDGFCPVEAKGKIIGTRRKLVVSVGDPEVFAIVDRMGEAIIGSKDKLVPKIEAWIEKVEDDIQRLNFAMFCHLDDRSTAIGRRVYRQKILDLDSEAAAARWFASAFLCLPLYQAIEQQRGFAGEHLGERSIQLSPKVVVRDSSTVSIVFPDGTTNKSSMLPIARNKNISKILTFARSITGHTYSFGSRPLQSTSDNLLADIATASPSSRPFLFESFSMQERRLAEILKLLILDANTGVEVLATYVDRSSYTNRAVNYLANLGDYRKQSFLDREKIVASAIPDLIRIAYPQQRGRLVVELARVLGRHQSISETIKLFLATSRQSEVREATSKAIELMNKAV